MSQEDGYFAETQLSGQENVNDLSIDSSSLRHVDTIRKSFEQGSQASPASFSFGEAFHQRQSKDRIGEQEKIRKAKEAMHGFRELEIAQEKTPGEIDRSPLAKTFTFDGQARDDGGSSPGNVVESAFDSKYKAAVFVVHQTQGMLLLRQHKEPGSIEIPGGSIEEIEISRAALKSSHYKMQLQLAAREAACRHLYEQTGVDTRSHLERLQPAVLHMEPPIGIDGIRLLRNELNDSFYYLLRVSPEDEGRNSNLKHCDEALMDGVGGCDRVDPFIFVKEPEKALELLETHGGCEAALAFQRVIDESRATPALCLNDSAIPEQEYLVRAHEEMVPLSKRKRSKRRKFQPRTLLRSALLCFRKS